MIHNKLPTKYYFINNFDTKILSKQDKETGIIYRNYKAKIDKKLIISLRDYCKKNNYKFYLSNNIKLAIKLNLDGAYIPSFYKHFNHLSFNLKKQFLILGSAHNYKEIKTKENQGVKIIFLSSIFKKNKNFLGINKFRNLTSHTNLNVIALGGVNKFNKKKLELTSCKGFAGISFFE